MAARKPRRIRDPIHDLIEFTSDDFDQMAWRALESREFQRLRRIKQLGFSELVFPGATHSRFAHSVGVFHTARRLSALIRKRLGNDFDPTRTRIATAAALVHDLGHGPFSHAFEDALKRLGVGKRHEDWTEAIINGDTEVSEVLSKYGEPGFQEAVAKLIASETPADTPAVVHGHRPLPFAITLELVKTHAPQRTEIAQRLRNIQCEQRSTALSKSRPRNWFGRSPSHTLRVAELRHDRIMATTYYENR